MLLKKLTFYVQDTKGVTESKSFGGNISPLCNNQISNGLHLPWQR